MGLTSKHSFLRYANFKGLWCNGNTTVFGAVIRGSNPCGPTILRSLLNIFSRDFLCLACSLLAHVISILNRLLFGVYTKDWGLGIFICLLGVNLSALSDDTESVVVEVFKSVGSSLYEFHFPVEAFSDTVVLSKSPHADDRFYPLG